MCMADFVARVKTSEEFKQLVQNAAKASRFVIDTNDQSVYTDFVRIFLQCEAPIAGDSWDVCTMQVNPDVQSAS